MADQPAYGRFRESFQKQSRQQYLASGETPSCLHIGDKPMPYVAPLGARMRAAVPRHVAPPLQSFVAPAPSPSPLPQFVDKPFGDANCRCGNRSAGKSKRAKDGGTSMMRCKPRNAVRAMTVLIRLVHYSVYTGYRAKMTGRGAPAAGRR